MTSNEEIRKIVREEIEAFFKKKYFQMKKYLETKKDDKRT